MTLLDTRSGLPDSTVTPPPLGIGKIALDESLANQYEDEATDIPAPGATGFRDPSEIYFSIALDNYLATKGVSQKELRVGTAEHITGSRRPQKRIRQVLERIRQRPSQDRLQAGIDLLCMTGPHIETLARELAYSSKTPNEHVAFVVAAAAGRANKELIGEVLVVADSPAMREAGVELAVSLGHAKARAILKRRARLDSDPYVRSRAEELLAEIG